MSISDSRRIYSIGTKWYNQYRPNNAYVAYDPNAGPGPGTVLNSEAEVAQALADGYEVVSWPRGCAFCGGPTPCLRDM
jgi:hypothetical protein